MSAVEEKPQEAPPAPPPTTQPPTPSPAPAAPPVYYPPPPPPKKSRTPIIIASIALIVFIVAVSLGGLYFYSAQAVNRLELTCATIGAVTTGGNPFSGLTATVPITYGVRNPTMVPITASWRITLNYGNGVVITTEKTFDIHAQSTAYPEFKITITQSQAQQIGSNSNPTLTFTENYRVVLYSFDRRTSEPLLRAASTSGTQPELPVC